MKRSPLKSRHRDTGPDFGTRLRVYERDSWCCVRCGQPARGERGVDYSLQHRKKRSAGVDNRCCNLILLCGDGTTGCHGWVEGHPIEAEHEGGWSVPGYADPAAVSVLIRHEYGEKWVYLTDSAEYADAPPVNAGIGRCAVSLYLTPTRRKLLTRVSVGGVHRYGDNHDYDGAGGRVDARMAELQRAGWVELGEPNAVKTPWLLTADGEKVLRG